MGLKINEAETPVVNQQSKISQQPSFRKNDFEKTPNSDNFEKKQDNTLKKAAIGTASAVALAALADDVFAHGKHIKKLFGIAEKDVKKAGEEAKPKPEIKPAEQPKSEPKADTSNPDYENWLKEQEEVKKAIEDSNQHNEQWLAEQQTAKEKEYSAWWNKELKAKEQSQIITKETEEGIESWQNGRKISLRCKNSLFEGIDEYDKAGEVIARFNLSSTQFYIYRDINGIESIIRIPYPKGSLDEMLALMKKYENLPKEDLESLYTEALQGNPKGLSETEFKFVEAYRDFHLRDYPVTSDATQIAEHASINGQNNRYRETPEIIEGKVMDDFSNEELDAMFENNEELYFQVSKNTDNKERLARMLKYDAEMASLPPLEKDCVFHRGIKSRLIPDVINANVGDVVKPDKGYAYYAFDRALADEFSGGAILTVHTPKGARISRNLDHGGEALFPRNAEYRVLSKGQTPDGDWRIELEYILP